MEISTIDFEVFFHHENAAFFHIASLSEFLVEKFEVKTNRVLISTETLRKNKSRHPELAISDYLLAEIIINQADLVVLEADKALLCVKILEVNYFLVLKKTASGQGIFLTSMRRMRQKELKNVRARGVIIFEK